MIKLPVEELSDVKKRIFALKHGWGGNDSNKPYTLKQWNSLESFVWYLETKFLKNNIPLVNRIIAPINDNSIDIIYEADNYKFAINIEKKHVYGILSINQSDYEKIKTTNKRKIVKILCKKLKTKDD